MTAHLSGNKRDEMFVKPNNKWFIAVHFQCYGGEDMAKGRRGEVHGKRLPDETYELIAFVEGVPVTDAFLRKPGTPLIRDRSLYLNLSEILLAEEDSEHLMIYPVSNIDGFIDAVGMRRLKNDG